MKTVLILAAGVWIGREIYTTLAKNQAREREVKIRKALEKFIQDNLPNLEPRQAKKEIDTILKVS
jgi:ABC-type transport system involved in cytochrome bd biosynthesis fused ATPase/permease subunit